MTMLLVSMAVVLGAPATPVSNEVSPQVRCVDGDLLDTYSGLWHAVRRQYLTSDRGAQGRNIRRWGLRNGKGAKCRDVARSVRTLRVLHMPRAARQFTSAGPPAQPPAGVQTVHAGGLLESIAQCESGGSTTVVNASGHGGKYQFSQATWNSVGGVGAPQNASEAEQDKRAAMLMAQQGTGPWSASQGCWGR